MPVLPSSAYSTVEGVLNLARALINDMMFAASGEILTDNAVFTFPMLNQAAEFFENELINHGVLTFKKETILQNITPVTPLDPGVQVNISDTGYFNGTSSTATPQLPTDLQVPDFLWERQSGSTENWVEMEEKPDGLESFVQTLRLRFWEWRQDGIYMPGCTQSEDIRLRYTSESVQFATPNDVILIRGSQSAIANYLAGVFAHSRGSPAAAEFSEAGKAFTLQICRRNTRARQRETVTRRPYGGVHSFWK